MKKQKVDTKLGVATIIIFAITMGVLVWIYEKNQINIKQPSKNTPDIPKVDNRYSNSDYGFSLNLPYALDKYVINVSPNTIAKISFLLPATDQKFLQYTGHKLTDAFNILAYPKSEIDVIRKECSMQTLKYVTYECTLNDEQPIAENNMYSFYYLKGGVGMGAYPKALEKEEYVKSENALKTFQTTQWSLNFNPVAWHIYTDHDYDFGIEYPVDWHTNGLQIPSIHKQDLAGVFSTSGQITDKINGSLGFGEYNKYNDALTNSIDGNVEYLNSKVNIIGSKSDFKEVKIMGGRAFYNPTQTTIAPNEREIFIIGKNVIFNGNFSTNSGNISTQELSKFIEIISRFKFLQ